MPVANMYKIILTSLFISISLSACGGGSGNDESATTSTQQNNSNTTTSSFQNLCSKSGVLFCEDFESGIKNDWIRDGGDVKLVNGQAKPNEGNNVIEFSTYENIQSSKLLYTFINQNEVYVRYDVQYASDYDNSGGSHGPVLGGSQSPPWGMMGTAGTRPSGSDYFVLNHEPNGIVNSNGEFAFYAYFVNMLGTPGNTWGNIFKSSLSPKPIISPSEWHCVEFGLRLNTAGASNTDGRAFFWVDGVQHGNFGNFQWRTTSNLMINTLMLDSYNHFRNGPLPASSPNRVRYDNVIISTQPVGCL